MQVAPQVISIEQAQPEAESSVSVFAHNLAKTHTSNPNPLLPQDKRTNKPNALSLSRFQKNSLLDDLQRWDLDLRKANALFKTNSARDAPVSRAGEWMLDNFYIVKQTLRQIEEDLPASFLNELPKLDVTSLKGHTRIFALAQAWIVYNQSQIDLTQTAEFVLKYQQFAPLTIGELWALPVMLRIGILERLVYATAELTGMEKPHGLSKVAEIDTGKSSPEPGLKNNIAGQLASPALPNETIVANCFLSLRLLSAADWKVFFEKTSLVEQILRKDPAGIYTCMDFKTRNSYRSVIEELARHSSFSEEEVATQAIEFSRAARETDPRRKAHIGFFLRDTGRAALESSLRYKPEFGVRLRRALLAAPTRTYLGSIAIFSGLFLLGLLAYVTAVGGSPFQIKKKK